MAKKIKVTVDTGKTLPMNYLEVLQGNLKDLSDENYKKLRASIIKHGFSFPIFVWENPEDAKIYIVDGHQRFVTLSKMKEDGYSVPQLPVVFIEATNLNHAKEKLAAAASQYGKFTEEGVASFFADMDFDIGAIEIPFLDFSKVIELDEGKTVEVAAHERTINEYKEAPLPDLSNDDAPDFKQITFIVHIDQLKEIERALSKAKNNEKFDDEKNENSNGNSLYFIAKRYNEKIG